jgi:hypothetical protein
VLNFYPNPATNELNIQAETEDSIIKIVNSNGAEVYSGKATDGKVDISNLPLGIYTISSTIEGKKQTKRFIKK